MSTTPVSRISESDRPQQTTTTQQARAPQRAAAVPRHTLDYIAKAGMGQMDMNAIMQAAMKDSVELRKLGSAGSAFRASGGAGRLPTNVQGAGVELSPEVYSKTDPRSHLINQGAYDGVALGYGSREDDIKRYGCLLVSMTTASNDLNRSAMDPIEANRRALAGNGFARGVGSGASANYANMANSLGLRMVGRGAPRGAHLESMRAAVDEGSNQAVIGQVKYRGRDGAIHTHFVHIDSKNENGNELYAKDPAGGRRITFRQGADGVYRSSGYQLVEAGIVAGTRAPRAGQIPNIA